MYWFCLYFDILIVCVVSDPFHAVDGSWVRFSAGDVCPMSTRLPLPYTNNFHNFWLASSRLICQVIYIYLSTIKFVYVHRSYNFQIQLYQNIFCSVFKWLLSNNSNIFLFHKIIHIKYRMTLIPKLGFPVLIVYTKNTALVCSTKLRSCV